MLPNTLWLLCLTALNARAQDTANYISITGSLSTLSTIPTSDFEGSQYTYISSTGQITVTTSSGLALVSGTQNSSTISPTSSSSDSQITRSSKSHSVTSIIGGTASRNATATASSTSSAAYPENTIPCNNYPEFCNRQYSNITEVCSHNSAFVRKNNAASNQELSIIQQLDDGVRMRRSQSSNDDPIPN